MSGGGGRGEGSGGVGRTNAVDASAAAGGAEGSQKKLGCFARGHGHCEWDGEADLKIHPALRVPICAECYKFYFFEEFRIGEDGSYEHCRCCADGSENLICCDKCPQTFCKPCIRNLAGRRYLEEEVETKDEWACFCCDSGPIASKQQKR